MYGSPTTKELKKRHLFRLVGGAEMGSWGGEESWLGGGSAGRPGQLGDLAVPHLCVDKLGGTLGSKRDCAIQGSNSGKKSLKTSDCKNLWGFRQQDKL